MSWRTHAMIVSARNLGRGLGINRLLASYLLGAGYETQYDRGFTTALKRGDCVWDVGANVGYYTRIFSERVGGDGIVIAFEPSPANFSRLNEACAGLKNVRMLQVGLGDGNGELPFEQGADDLGATSRIVEPRSGGMRVPIRSAASLLQTGELPRPNAIKIDVEGFEHEVLKGLGDFLAARCLRAIGVEIHFGVLKDRGMAQSPRYIEKLLGEFDFVVNWPDSSHILAIRHGP